MDLYERLKQEFSGSVELTPAGGDDAVDGVRPQAVAAPLDEAAAVALARWCGQEKIALAARGGGSKIGWGAPPARCELILSSRYLNKIVDHDTGNATVTAQSGIALAELDRRMREHGQYLPLDFEAHPGATLGGVTAANHSGATRLRYRTPRDMVVGMSAVLSDGSLIKAGSKVVKNVSGYDLGKLFIGSYGTLGFITSVTVRLRPCEEKSSWWQHDYASWEDAAAMAEKMQHGLFEPALLRLHATENTFRLTARFDGIAESVQSQLEQLPASEQDAAQADHADGNTTLDLRAQMPLAHALAFAQSARDEGASNVQWDCALGAVLASWETITQVSPLVDKLRAHATAAGGFVFVQKAPAAQKTAELVWGETRSDFALHRQLKQRFDAAGIFSPGRFWGGL